MKVIQFGLILLVAASANADWLSWLTGSSSDTNTTTTTTTTTTPAPTSTTASLSTTKAAAGTSFFDPLGLFSNTLNAVGSAVQSTGGALVGAVTNPFGIFGSEAPVKIDLITCFTNLFNQTVNILIPILDLFPSCAIAVSGNLWDLTSTSIFGVITPLQTAFINSFMSLFSCGRDFNGCVTAIINNTVDNLLTLIKAISTTSLAAIPIGNTAGKAALDCLTPKLVNIAKLLPSFSSSLACLPQI